MSATISDVLDGRAQWAVIKGEALGLLRELPDACADAVITDPPYSSGGAFRGDRMQTPSSKYVTNSTKLVRPDFSGDNRDQLAHEYWCALWLSEARRVAKPGAPICVFTDWRQLGSTALAIQAGGWVYRGILVWDKTEGVRPQKGRFAQQCEFVVWGSNGPMSYERRVGCLPGLVRHYPNPREKNHITAKTKETMVPIVRITEPGGLILDPFCGGGSTGRAAVAEGYRFLGFELVDAYAELAREYLAAEERAPGPARACAQTTIFDALASQSAGDAAEKTSRP